jgi:hypothetical protein
MTEMKRLTDDGRRLIDERFLRGDREQLSSSEVQEFLEPVTTSGEARIEELGEELEAIKGQYDRYDPHIDAEAAPHVHRCLDISRRVASDPGVWHYLTTVHYPGFVRHRWEYNTKRAMTEKFLAAGRDIYSNALHRLWWIAELTYQEGDSESQGYDLTQRVLRNQTLANRIFDRDFARYKPASIACVEALVDESTDVADKTTLRFSHALTNLQLEGMSEKRLYEVIVRIREEVKANE